jgi:hypothetical protein
VWSYWSAGGSTIGDVNIDSTIIPSVLGWDFLKQHPPVLCGDFRCIDPSPRSRANDPIGGDFVDSAFPSSQILIFHRLLLLCFDLSMNCSK